MSNTHIQQCLANVAEHFTKHPQDAISQDKPAVAKLEEGLRCRASGPNGATLVSDMPTGIGGAGTAPTPGWFMRAAMANCDATVIAMRAAQLGISLSKLEVTVGSESDNRGLLGIVDSAPAGPLSTQVTVRIAAPGVSDQALHELVQWAVHHSPVSDAVRRAVPVLTQVMVE